MTCNHKDNYLKAIDGPCGYCEQVRAEAAEAKNAELEGAEEVCLKSREILRKHLTKKLDAAEQQVLDLLQKLREPTGKMIKAGKSACGYDVEYPRRTCLGIFKAMIKVMEKE